MEIKYLQAILAVAKYMSFNKAAEATHMAQSSISRQVKIVETELGMPLFDRSFAAGKAHLTPFGEQAVPLLREIYDRYEAVLKLHQCESPAKKPVYQLGVHRGPFSSFDKAKLTAELYLNCPEIDVILHDVPHMSDVELLRRGNVDGLLYYKPHMKNSNARNTETADWLEKKTVYRKYPCIAMPDEHPLAANETVRFEDLRNETFLFYYDFVSEGVHAKEEEVQGFLQSCLNAGFTPNIKVLPVETLAEVRNVAIRANGWMYPTFMPEVTKSPTGVAYVPVQDPIFYAEWLLAYMKTQKSNSLKVWSALRKTFATGDNTMF